jgi:hypothetical protein
MDDLTTTITDKIVESVNLQMTKIMDYSGAAIVFSVLFLFSYAIGFLLSEILRKILKFRSLEEFIVKYGVMRVKAWGDTISFLVIYARWFVTISILTLSDISLVTTYLYPLMYNLFGFIVLILVGLTLGGIASKFIRDVSMDFGWDEKLAKYGLADAFGDISITTLLTGIAKYYILLLFLAQGIDLLGNLTILSKLINEIISYMPQALLGAAIMLLALLVADYTADRIKHRKFSLDDMLAFCVRSVIIFFGAVIALPHLGVTNVSILEDSFKILLLGVALALAIAVGFGLKDYISRLAQK